MDGVYKPQAQGCNTMTSQTLTKITPLRAWRERRSLSLDELSARAGVSVATLWRAEVGRSKPYPRTRRRIAAALNVDVAQLVDAAWAVGGDWAA